MNSIAMLRFIVHLSVLVRSDLSQLLYSFWRVGIIMSKLKNKSRSDVRVAIYFNYFLVRISTQ